MSTGEQGPEPTEEELRAAYEEQIKQIRVEHVVLENVVTLINLGMRRTGLVAGTEAERDPVQVRLAIESIRVLLPLLEQAAPEQVKPIRDALSQLQLAFVRIGGQADDGPEAAAEAEARSPGPAGPGPERDSGQGSAGERPGGPAEPGKPGGAAEEPGPAQRSGRLWIPGQ